METIGDRLKHLRKENNLTQKDMAEKLGIHPNTISMYEKGNRNIPSTMIKKISDAFNISTDYLLRGEETKEKQEFSSLDESLLKDENYLNLTLKNMLKDSQMVAFQDYKSWSVEDKKELLLILLDKK